MPKIKRDDFQNFAPFDALNRFLQTLPQRANSIRLSGATISWQISPPQFGSDGVQWKVVLIVNNDEFYKSLDSIWCKSVKFAKLNAAEKFQADPEKSSH
eukprot:s1582_g6.t1